MCFAWKLPFQWNRERSLAHASWSCSLETRNYTSFVCLISDSNSLPLWSWKHRFWEFILLILYVFCKYSHYFRTHEKWIWVEKINFSDSREGSTSNAGPTSLWSYYHQTSIYSAYVDIGPKILFKCFAMKEAFCWWNHTVGMTSPLWISVFALWNLLSYFPAMVKCQMWSEELTSQVGIQWRLFKSRLQQAGRKCKGGYFCSNRMPFCPSLSSLLTARSNIWSVTTNMELH